MRVHCEAAPTVHRHGLFRRQGIRAISSGFHKKLRANQLGDIGNLPAIRLQQGNAFDRMYGTIVCDTSVAKSKVPFSNTIATFRGRTSKPAVVVSCQNFQKEFSDDELMLSGWQGAVLLRNHQVAPPSSHQCLMADKECSGLLGTSAQWLAEAWRCPLLFK